MKRSAVLLFALLLGLLGCAGYKYLHFDNGTCLKVKSVRKESDKYYVTLPQGGIEKEIQSDRVTHVNASREGDILQERLDDQVSGEDLSGLADKLAGQLQQSGVLARKGKVPVVAFMHVTNNTAQHFNTDIVTDKIMERLLGSGNATFVSKEKRQALMAEVAFSQSGATENTLEAGKMQGVDFFMYGDISSIEKKKETFATTKNRTYHRLSLKLLDVETGQIVWMGSKDWYAQEGKFFLQ